MSRTAARNRTIWGEGVKGALGAAGVNLTLFVAGRAADVDFVVPGRGPDAAASHVSAGHVIVMSLLFLVLGTAVAVFAARRGKLRHLQIVGALFALITAAGPLSLEADGATRLLLAAMHVVAGASFVVALERARRAAPRETPVVGSRAPKTAS